MRILTFLLALSLIAPPLAVDIPMRVATAPVANDADDPAIWVHPGDPSQSLIIATDKSPAPDGGLFVFDLDGQARQRLGPIDRPNNVDVEYGLVLRGQPTDIAVVTERLQRRLRVYHILPDERRLQEISPGGLAVFEGEVGEQAAPMGIALYRRTRDGAVFAIVGRKEGPRHGYLWQYRLEDDGSGKVKAKKVREFGLFSGQGEIEVIAVDDSLGYIYYADEGRGIFKYHADPDHPDAARALAHFGADGFSGDREGIAIYARAGGTGYIVCTDQISGNSQYRLYRREGERGNPHDHSTVHKIVRGGADSTDGIEVTSAGLGPRFATGALVAMNDRGRNFLVFSWQDIASFGEPKLGE
jgi:3-phytase